MKKLILASCMVILAINLFAQSWNPYVNQGIISPSPLLPLEFNGEGMASFNIGNTGSSPLIFDVNKPDRNLSVVITLNNGIPAKTNPIAAIGGSWKNKFSWSYNASSRTYTGVQVSTIPAISKGTITIAYKVDINTPMVAAANGFSINLQPPAYINGPNTTQDDAVSSYTYTRAYDYGDGPKSYGIARHDIDVFKDPESGFYTKYICLGGQVDQEAKAFSSDRAVGDDKNGIDDEDGVKFPELWAGKEVTIPLTVTVYDESYGILNAWFDWNLDGDFTDAGEKVPGTPVTYYESGNYFLTFTIPEYANTDRFTFARFRIGANGGPTAINSWGEAEDYEVQILKPGLQATFSIVNVQHYGESTGSIDLTVSNGTPPYNYSWSNGESTQDISNLKAGIYGVTIKDANNVFLTKSATISQPTNSSTPGTDQNQIFLSGERVGIDINLSWETPTEVNTDWFKVERSIDGGEFEQIGQNIIASGNSNTKSVYTYSDKKVYGEIAIYRVRLVETAKTEKLSNTHAEILDNNGNLNISVFPNPVIDYYSVTIDNYGSYILELVDSNGKIVFTSAMEVLPGSQGIKQFDREGMFTGAYFMRVIDKNNGNSKTIKLVFAH
jgi:hypothetical protein